MIECLAILSLIAVGIWDLYKHDNIFTLLIILVIIVIYECVVIRRRHD